MRLRQRLDKPRFRHGGELVPQIMFATLCTMFKSFLAWLVCAAAACAAERKFDFSQFAENQTPTNFRAAITGQGPPGDWRVLFAEVPAVVPLLSPKAPVVTKRAV